MPFKETSFQTHRLGEILCAVSKAGKDMAFALCKRLSGEVMGRPQDMSPEPGAGMVGELDARSDIYPLRGILYAIITLLPPIDGKTLNEVLTKVKNGEIRHFNESRVCPMQDRPEPP